MQCTLLIPHLFWPRATADAVEQALEIAQLRKLISRARVERFDAVATEAWLCQAFEVQRQQDWPVAPLTLALDGGEPGDHYWLRADPVHIKVSREGLHLVDSRLFELSADDAQTLAEALRRHFADAEIEFHAPHPKRWYAKLSRAPALVTDSIDEVAGRDVQRHLPRGADALAWHRLFNEAQMLLHEHPVNEAREARGEPPVNSVWFWGGGTRVSVRAHPFDAVYGDSALATALAVAADVHAEALPSDARAWLEAGSRRDRGSALVVLDQLAPSVAYEDADAWRTRIAALETQWIAPLVGATRAGRIESVALVALADTHSLRFTLRRADLRKFWRADKPLAAYA